ncbi:B3 domain-containing protein REM9 isoform X2 [Spinacia oleracea]|uniref:B3 domain-containing protein REM9 isoform X2 n=1 Tax=Spinacia oleracea TaxID=3562 RepID=A0ABM3QGN5_SPIOL|nr:B3 domain-containing protein REM9-like isoform X2 [Spinacia oleracea]
MAHARRFFQPMVETNWNHLNVPVSWSMNHSNIGGTVLLQRPPSTNVIWFFKVSHVQSKNGEVPGKMKFGEGWVRFRKENEINIGDFMVFEYLGDSTFNVIVFAPNGCNKFPDIVYGSATGISGSARGNITGSSRGSSRGRSAAGMSSQEENAQAAREALGDRSFIRMISDVTKYSMNIPMSFIRDHLGAGHVDSTVTLRVQAVDRQWIARIKTYPISEYSNEFYTRPFGCWSC